MVPAPTRRARLREELTAEIKAAALAQLAEGGPQAVTLRGIARDLGMSPAALYSYFASLEDLYTALIIDGFVSHATWVATAMDLVEADQHADRMLSGLLAYRLWAIEHPELFRLLYFSPVPGYQAPEDGEALHSALLVSAAFLSVLVDAWAGGATAEITPGPPVDPSKFEAEFGLRVTSDQLRTAMGCWGQFHGLVALEVGGHISAEWCDPANTYEASVRSMGGRTGLPPASEAVTTSWVTQRLAEALAAAP
ncbi:MAG: TetR/AcrR family transcriptional regulator [Acidimicrobiales bacterium]|nr:TetR/AcrR family transcriptional regulator [Acidimicrobiales bacterium]